MTATYQDIKADIMRRIADGRWRPGALLPTEQDLAGRYDCARATVNRAMRELADAGIVERKRKAGTRVRTAPLREARFEIPLVRAEIEAQGLAYGYTLVDRAEHPAPAWLRDRLDLAPDARVLHLTCLHTADSTPYQFEDRWISLAALPQARDADFTQIGPNEWLIATVPFSDVEIAFSATEAGPVTAEHLDCRPGDALFQVERATWWQGQAITHVRLVFRPGHRMTTRY